LVHKEAFAPRAQGCSSPWAGRLTLGVYSADKPSLPYEVPARTPNNDFANRVVLDTREPFGYIMWNRMVTFVDAKRNPWEAAMQVAVRSAPRPAMRTGGVKRRRERDAVFRALADPTRREILGILRSGQQTVGEIAGNFRMSRPAVSKHLRLLRKAGLVVTRQEGTSRHCGLNAKPLREVDDWLHDYEMFWSKTLDSLKEYLEENR
jgi:DNA-binding transcriptional ArsR family regulator